MLFLTLSVIFLLLHFYNRYFPIFGITKKKKVDSNRYNIVVVDVRDYIVSYKDPVKDAVNIPIAYLKRNYYEITNGNVYVIASNIIEKNMGIRLLRQKGFRIMGYSIFKQEKNISYYLKERKVPCKFME